MATRQSETRRLDGSYVQTEKVTQKDTKSAGSSGINQGSSTFEGELNMSGKSSADQGNSINGDYKNQHVTQEGSMFKSKVTADDEAKIRQGNKMVEKELASDPVKDEQE